MTLRPDVRIGPYEIESLVGESGFGEVWKGRDSRNQRDVALRVLPRAAVDDPNRFRSFKYDMNVLASLRHPNLASMIGIVEHDNLRILVVEWIEGTTLRDRAASGPRLSVDAALLIAAGIAHGLTVPHSRAIAHGNLNPSNVKICADGSVKVLDCGLTMLIEPASDHSARLFATVIGTAAYMSPEQARGERVTRASDVWAFGCVLYELLVGRQAFGAYVDPTSSTSEAAPDLTLLPPTTPSSIVEFLRRCLNRDSDKRPVDLSEASYLNLEGTVEIGAAEAFLRDSALAAMMPEDESRPDSVPPEMRELRQFFRRWLKGRIPSRLGLTEDDVVEETVRRALKLFEGSYVRDHEALRAYMRSAIVNYIRDEVRRHGRTHLDERDEVFPDDTPEDDTPESRAEYQVALRQLTDRERELVVLRVEMQLNYAEIARMLGLPSDAAAHMAVSRALRKLIAVLQQTKQR